MSDANHYVLTQSAIMARDLEKAMAREIVRAGGIYGKPVLPPTKPKAPKAKEEADSLLPLQPTLKRILDTVARETKIPVNELISPRRRKDIVRARMILFYLCRRLTAKSLPVIGRAFHRDHSTILHAIQSVESKRPYFEPEVSRLMAMFEESHR